AERVRTIGGAFLGATLGCCECHDHKFDPFTAKDFYSMESYFADMKQWGYYADAKYSPNPELKGFGNEHPFPPEIQVDSRYLIERGAKIRGKMKEIASVALEGSLKNATAKENFAKWQENSLAFFKSNPTGWETPVPEVKLAAAMAVQAKGTSKQEAKAAKAAASKARKEKTAAAPEFPSVTPLADGRILFPSNMPADNTSITLRPAAGWVSAVRVELLPDELNRGSILRTGAEESATLKLSVAWQKAGAKKAESLAFRDADANFKEARYSGGSEIIGIKEAWKTSAKEWNRTHVAIGLFDHPVKISEGDTLTILIAGDTAGCVRVSVSPFAPAKSSDQPFMASLQKAFSGHDEASRALLKEAYLAGTAWNERAFQEYAAQGAELQECRDGKAWTMVTQPIAQPLTIRVLPRGNWMDESGAVVEPASPAFLPTSFKPQAEKRLTRLDLAHWLCSRENPLTPRAEMNRLWKQFFGNGLSSIVDDLGAQGEPPSHPELLDWIAAEFRDSGWDVKHMIRLFVTSNSYRQSSSLRKDLRNLDPGNRLLSSQNPRRLDAEFVRDNALFISGLLNLDLGGPSVKPYQPAGYYANLQFPNRDYVADTDDRQWRRGVYMHWQRTFL
ncbi:MAG TPA: DUF1553 domain-containing protein, partial [Verrucomicrobiaceae bacterium]